ncbi:MAG: DsbA family protein [Myxococcota bacterium]|nr:DsbA family protein [Myxococcota bacterium]
MWLNIIIIQLLTHVPIGATKVDPTALSQSEQQVFNSVRQDTFCSCTSAMTLAGCSALRPDCQIATHLDQIIFRAIQAGNTQDELLSFLPEHVLGPFCKAPQNVRPKKAPNSKGTLNGRVKIYEFADFRCGHCKKAVEKVKTALKSYPKQVEFSFIPFPLNDHPESLAAAEAVMAAGEQNKFWEMHDALFKNQKAGFRKTEIDKLARKLHLNLKSFNTALASGKYKRRLEEFKKLGTDLGVRGTPAFFVNGRSFRPVPGVLPLTKRIAMELDRNEDQCQ